MLPVCEEIASSSCIKREVCQLTLFDEQELKWKLDEDFKDDVRSLLTISLFLYIYCYITLTILQCEDVFSTYAQ